MKNMTHLMKPFNPPLAKDLPAMMLKPTPSRRKALWLAMPLLTIMAFPAFAQTWKINLQNADINAFVSEVADITGKNFAVDPRVKGNVTVISNKELTRAEVYDLFQGVLNVNGVVAIPSGNTIKLVPDVNAKQSGVPFDLRSSARGDGVVTRVIWLDNTNPNDLVPALRPLLSQFAHLAAVPGTNALIVSDRAESITQLAELVHTLDGGDDQLDIIALKETNVDDILAQLEQLTQTSAVKDVRGSRLRIIADEHSNRLLVKGDERSRKKIEELVKQLDVAPSDRLDGLKVFRLKNASAKNMAAILQGLVTGKSPSSSSSGSSSTRSSSSNSTSSLGSSSSAGSSLGSSSSFGSDSSSSGSSNNSDSAPTVFSANGVSIIANEELNALVVKADPTLMREISRVIDQLDVRRAQVLIQAAIVEVSGTNAQQLGVQWAMGNASSGLGVINFSNGSDSIASIAAAAASKSYSSLTVPDGATVGLGVSKTNSSGQTSFYGAIVNALNSTSGANLISVPSVMVLDNVEAKMVVGQNVPFITGSTTTTSDGTTTPFTTIERQDVGVTLKVTPHIGEGGTLRLEVSQEVSAIEPTSSIGATTADVVTSKRAVETTVLADDKQTIVLGGMMQNDNSQSLNSVPGLSSIPYLGALFRSKANSYTKDNLLIFLQPTILRDGSNVDGISQDRYSQIRELQLQLDPNGQFSRLPISANQVYASAVSDMNPSLSKALNDDFADRNKKTKPTTPVVQPQVTPVVSTPDAQP